MSFDLTVLKLVVHHIYGDNICFKLYLNLSRMNVVLINKIIISMYLLIEVK